MECIDWNGKAHALPPGRTLQWRPSAYAFILHENKLLLNKSTFHGKWDLPGGKIELGETIPQGLIREVKEETGYDITLVHSTPRYLTNQFFYVQDKDEYCQTIFMVFACELLSTQKEDSDWEVQESQWFSREECSTLTIHPLVHAALLEIGFLQ